MNISKARKIACAIVCLAMVAIISGCSSKSEEGQGKSTLIVSVPPQQYLLQEIVGDKYAVESLLTPGTDPETYDPGMSMLIKLQDSPVWFKIGYMGFEDAAQARMKDSFPNLMVTDCSVGIDAITDSHGSHSHGHEGEEAGDDHSHGIPDPHIWNSIPNSLQIAENMYRTMVEVDPDNEEYYSERYSLLKSTLENINDSIMDALEEKEGRAFIIWHPSLSYFARDYGLQQIAIEADGREASPKEMQAGLEKSRQTSPTVVFAEKGHDAKPAENMARDLQLPIVEVSLTDKDYIQQLLKAARAL